MLKNITYNDPVIKRDIELAVGKPYSFWQSLKMGGTGSQKFIITEASEEIKELLNRENAANYSNIELRPKGIIVGFKSHTNSYGLIIPFSKLKMTVIRGKITLSSDDFFVTMKSFNKESIDQKFLKKIKAA